MKEKIRAIMFVLAIVLLVCFFTRTYTNTPFDVLILFSPVLSLGLLREALGNH